MPLSAKVLKQLKEYIEYNNLKCAECIESASQYTRCSDCGSFQCSWECIMAKSERIEFEYEAKDFANSLNGLYNEE